MEKIKITVVGSGYVGMSLSVLLAKQNCVTVLDIDSERISKINNKKSTIEDSLIEELLDTASLNLTATNNPDLAYADANFIIIATPTDYDVDSKNFDTSSVDQAIKKILTVNNDALIVIKSTLPIGHTAKLRKKFRSKNIVFSPEFLREGQALNDNLFPSRIIVGGNCLKSKNFATLLKESAQKDNVEVIFMESTEAESVKLFSNAYLAMRVSFFNELDSFAMSKKLDSKKIIEGICLDDRIGSGYNNPSFGYGGYCLPKDTKQLLTSFEGIPQNLIRAIVDSNETRKLFLSNEILKSNHNIIGFYRLTMKEGSDNFRFSAIQDLIDKINGSPMKIIIYEPKLDSKYFNDFEVLNDLNRFKDLCNLIVANRVSEELKDVEYKCFTRDIFGEN